MVVGAPPPVHYSDNASAFCDLLIAPVMDNRFLFQELRRFVHFRPLFFIPMPQTFRYPVSVGTDFPFGSHLFPLFALHGYYIKEGFVHNKGLCVLACYIQASHSTQK